MFAGVVQVQLGGRRCIKTDFFFRAPSVPDNYFEVNSWPNHAWEKRSDMGSFECVALRIAAARVLSLTCHSDLHLQVVGPRAAPAEQSGTKTSQEIPVGKAAQQGTAHPAGAAQPAPTEEMGTTASPQEAGILIGNDLLPVGITTYTEVSANLRAHTVECSPQLGDLKSFCQCCQCMPLRQLCSQLCKQGNAAQFFSEAEMQRLEAEADGTHAKADARLPLTAFHKTHALGGTLRRTKMFFGARCEFFPACDQCSDHRALRTVCQEWTPKASSDQSC